MACTALVAPAFGAFDPLAVFGQPGDGAGTLGPNAPAIAVDPAGRVYVADISDDRIEAFRNDGTPDGGWGGLANPSGVAAAPDGSVVVADSTGVYRYDSAGSRLATLTLAGGVVGAPAGVAVGPDGTVYVADRARGQVVALPGRVYAGLQRPVAVAAAADGSIYVADAGDERVHAFGPGGNETASWPVDDPAGVAVAPDASVLVSDNDHGQVLQFSPAGASRGAFGRSNVPGRLASPHGVATDCRGRAYVVDNSTPRVHVFGDPGPPPPCVVPPPPEEPAPVIAPPPEPEPVLGQTARATAISGEVLVGEGRNLHALRSREIVPVGTTIDSTDGRVKLEFETAPGADRGTFGRFMEGQFYDGQFTIEQSRSSSLVDLNLIEDDDGESTPRAAGLAARASQAKKKKKRVRMWGDAKGRFRTVGRNGAATVRGTRWLTSEHSDGTFFRVLEGVVQVREFASKRLVTLLAGDEFLARPACVSKRDFQIRLRVPRGETIRSAVVTVRGRRVKVKRGSRLTAPVDLRGAPDGPVTVRIRVRTSSGRVLTGTRRYVTCTNIKRLPKEPPEL
ncbi:MAG TPA: NHL repeat-containing protein [Solirubrobacteraceae bacterium]|nr:NHL repeat-containing protein [Solirubrobacteraceae bacterium]